MLPTIFSNTGMIFFSLHEYYCFMKWYPYLFYRAKQSIDKKKSEGSESPVNKICTFRFHKPLQSNTAETIN